MTLVPARFTSEDYDRLSSRFNGLSCTLTSSCRLQLSVYQAGPKTSTPGGGGLTVLPSMAQLIRDIGLQDQPASKSHVPYSARHVQIHSMLSSDACARTPSTQSSTAYSNLQLVGIRDTSVGVVRPGNGPSTMGRRRTRKKLRDQPEEWERNCVNLGPNDLKLVTYQCLFKCPGTGEICGKEAGKQTVKRHYMSMHQNLRPHGCPYLDCGKKFAQYSTLDIHISSVHTFEKKYPCVACEEAFTDPSQRTKHAMVAHPELRLVKKRRKEPFANTRLKPEVRKPVVRRE